MLAAPSPARSDTALDCEVAGERAGDATAVKLVRSIGDIAIRPNQPALTGFGSVIVREFPGVIPKQADADEIRELGARRRDRNHAQRLVAGVTQLACKALDLTRLSAGFPAGKIDNEHVLGAAQHVEQPK